MPVKLVNINFTPTSFRFARYLLNKQEVIKFRGKSPWVCSSFGPVVLHYLSFFVQKLTGMEQTGNDEPLPI